MQFRLLGYRTFGLALLIALSLALSACGMVEDMMGSSETTADDPPESGLMEEPASESAAQVDEPAAIDPAIAALLPSEPAPVGSSFRPDSAQVVGMTGRPQLLEFFTYW